DGGGGIFNNGGIVSIGSGQPVNITNNVADGASGSGGGIFNAVGGVLSVDGGTISGNSANRAGGGIEDASGPGLGITLTDVNLDNNLATGGGNGPGNGGGLHVTGTGDVSISGGTVNGNSAALEGGGLWNGGGTMIIDGTTISGNTASGDAADDGGGGIFNNGGTVEIGPATITNNVADGASGSGGGILNLGGTITIDNTQISGNSANRAGGGIEDAGSTGLSITLTNVNLDNNLATGGGNGPGNGGGLHVTGTGDVSITGGTVNGNSAALEGGGLWNGGGTMTIDGTVISGNTASGDAADDGGGGIFNNGGIVDIGQAIITNNVADGASGSGGGILNLGGTITVDNTLIDGNSASRAGGGIEDQAGELVSVTDSVISDNNAGSSPGNGGGIHITGAGTVDIDGSTISGNTAVEGGGLWNSGSGTFTLTNSTISGNTATGSDGGGIFNTSGGTILSDSVTITLNSASTGVGSGVAGGTSGVTLENTIVAQNPGGGTEQNLAGNIDSADFNLIGDVDDGTLTGFTVNTIFDANALLLPLADYGGPTPTHLPAAGSPAIGFGTTTLAIDQRDVIRPEGGQDDIGAVEVDLNGFVITANFLADGNGGDGNPDEFLIRNDTNGLTGNVEVYVNSQLVFSEPQATTGLILIRGSADNDTLIVDSINGLIGPNIVFDGDGFGGVGEGIIPIPGGFDVLRMINLPGVSTTTYNPGEQDGDGAVLLDDNQQIQSIEFFGLEPVQVLAPVGGNNILNVASAPLGVGFPQALNADNSINYVEGPNSNDPLDPVFAGAITGLVTVDAFESLEFANFETLNIDAGAGNDHINLNHENATPPAELTAINIDGGDPSASDTLVVNSTPGSVEAFRLAPTAQGAGQITSTLAPNPPVNYTAIEHIDLVLQANDVEGGDLDGTIGNDHIEVTPSAGGVQVVFSGLMDTNNATGNGPFSLPEVTFHNVNRNIGIGINENVAGGTDTINYNGTSSNDEITINGELVDSVQVLRAGSGSDTSTTQVNLIGGDGSDVFNVTPSDRTSIAIRGGQPDSGSDVLNFNGTGGAITVNLDLRTITEAGLLPVSYDGAETVNIDGNADVTVIGGAADDIFDVTPATAGNDGSFTHNGSNGVAFNYTNATTITFSGGGGTDSLNVLGDAGVDTVTSAAGSVTVNGSTVTLGADLEMFSVSGLAGNDNIDLTNLVFAGPITISGGAGDDVLTGSAQADNISGGAGNDTIAGLAGDDVIDGGQGNDS
ncbi:MAG: hypothetical protein MI861_02455, partial [Pirellulales bacterium]|nr:hypothetical protein [Pirellulales bacterium]